jgi:hypothetical protein
MPNIDLSILNQRQTPAFYADTLANRPAAGFVGRIFVSTNTFAFYRDNGTGWDLIGGPGTGTVTGTGANGQVTFWNGASTITGSNDLFWDSANGHFGVNTNVPGTALDVHHDQPTVAILNQTVATNDVRIGFQNNGVGLWRIGAFYNAGANDFGIYDAVAAIQPVTVKKTTGQVLIGTSTVGSGKLVVASSTGDNGIQIVGATAPSLRIDSAESGPTKRAGFGISTATNNFIQGSADRDFCMFNGSTTASPILFGVYDAGASNVQEAARISAARNFLVGTTTDGGQKLQISGSARATSYYLDGMTAGSGALYYSGSRLTLANYNASGTILFEVNGGATSLTLNSDLSASFVSSITSFGNASTNSAAILYNSAGASGTAQHYIDFGNGSGFTAGRILRGNGASGYIANGLNILSYSDFQISANALGGSGGNIYLSGGNVGINTTTVTAPLTVSGTTDLAWSASTSKLQISRSGTLARLQNYDNGSGSSIALQFDGANVLIGTTTDNGNKLQVIGNTYTEGVYIATGQFSQGGSATSTFYTFSNISSNRMFLITLRQSGSSANNVVAVGFVYAGVLAAYNVVQDNTNPALFLTITSTGGLGLQLTTGAGYGTTTWEYTITQIK